MLRWGHVSADEALGGVTIIDGLSTSQGLGGGQPLSWEVSRRPWGDHPRDWALAISLSGGSRLHAAVDAPRVEADDVTSLQRQPG